MTSSSPFPNLIYAEASVTSMGGVSLFDTSERITCKNVDRFRSSQESIDEAVRRFRDAKFQIVHIGDTTISIAGTKEQFESVFKTSIYPQDRQVIKEGARLSVSTFFETADTDSPGYIDTGRSALSQCVEGISINEPVYYFAETAVAPPVNYFHLTLNNLKEYLNVPEGPLTGKGVKVTMVDSGWYNHEYFRSQNLTAQVHPGLPTIGNLDHDEHGHGTGESANLLAIAPGIDFHMVKMAPFASAAALKAAIDLKPDIISCSWGSNKPMPPLTPADQVLAAVVADAISKGIILVFASGNGHFGFPGQHPDVISAGGVFIDKDGNKKASDYSSGFMSTIYPNRSVPDVCGLVGTKPKAVYIMLPIEPGCNIDIELAGGGYPITDETASNDGWAAFSGTSAAAPQVAAVCALMKEARPELTPAAVKKALTDTASDIIEGDCSQGYTAVNGPDLATGYGLVNCKAAIDTL